MENRDTLMRYILGDLDQGERERVERRYFVNDEAWAELQAAETDLIDSYVRGELSQKQREQFEKYFLASPRRRQRFEFARTKMAAASVPVEEPHRWWKMPMAFAGPYRMQVAVGIVILLAGIAVVTLIQDLRLRGQLSKMQAAERTRERQKDERQQGIANRKEARDLRDHGPAELLSQRLPTISLLLTPGQLRSSEGGSQLLPICTVPCTVLLLLKLEEDRFSSYEVLLRTVEGKENRRLAGLKSSQLPAAGPVVAVDLPSKLFRRGDYIATLSGNTSDGKAEVIDSFTFTVVR